MQAEVRTQDRTALLLERHISNPILTADDWPYPVNSVFNPGAARLPSGETVLLCRAEDRSGHSHLCVARSHDGVTDWRIDEEPTMLPDPKRFPEDAWGIEDARVVHLEERGQYAVTFTSLCSAGTVLSLAMTEDFITFDRLGAVLPVDNKDAALFPRKIDGRWAMIHRPFSAAGGGHIWMCYSSDLRHWGDHKVILSPTPGYRWDSSKIGLSTPPIETAQGWLLLYHGVKTTACGAIYRVGAALLDLDDPTKCIRRGSDWFLGPHADYERVGDVGNVVFPSGYTLDDDNDRLNIYYGAADTSIGLATAGISEILDWLNRHG